MKVTVKKLKVTPVKRGKLTGIDAGTAINQRKSKKSPVENTVETVEIVSDFIRLDDFLKLCGCFGTGGMAKMAIQGGEVALNGEICLQRGKKLVPGDHVTFDGHVYEVAKQ